MSAFVLTNVRLFGGGCDFTSRSNKVELDVEGEVKDSTNFGSGGWKECLCGLLQGDMTAEGQWEAFDASKVDDDRWASLGAVTAYTLCPDTADVGDLAWTLKSMEAQYKLGGQVGEIAPWTMSAKGAWPLGRGKVLHDPGTARTSSGNGTAVQLSAASSSQYLYATLHVLSVSGTDTPTLTVKVQSDTVGFASATDQITFTAATTVGSQISRLVGPITDDYYRVSWTISGTNPSFLFVAAVSIQ